jgi:hypothetical protein
MCIRKRDTVLFAGVGWINLDKIGVYRRSIYMCASILETTMIIEVLQLNT